jgi:excisionase family DNA binding protein
MTKIRNLDTHDEPMVTPSELAAYFRVTERAIYALIGKGALPALKVGKCWRIRTADARALGRIEEPITGPIASA